MSEQPSPPKEREQKIAPINCWAKTTVENTPGISVLNHCVNVGTVAQRLAEAAGSTLRWKTRPDQIATLAALHDIGKVSQGFQVKCAAWILQRGLSARAEKERWTACESDHSKVSQYSIGRLLKARGLKAGHAEAWATAIGAHHGAPHGWSERGLVPKAGMKEDEWEVMRQALALELGRVFGQIDPPTFKPDDARLWAIAGLISVADWIGSDEKWFSPGCDFPIDESQTQAAKAVGALRMDVRHIATGFGFHALFDGKFKANALQQAVLDVAKKPGICRAR